MTEIIKVVDLYDEKYIKVEDALEYLDSRDVVLELKNIYLNFKGFAFESEDDFNFDTDSCKRYIKGVFVINRDESSFWESYGARMCYQTSELEMVSGFINGLEINSFSITKYFCENNGVFTVDSENCLIKKVDLDELAKKFGIPPKKKKAEELVAKQVFSQETTRELNSKSETTYQHIIGSLLEYIKGDTPTVKQHPEFVSEAAMIELLAAKYSGYAGMSKRTLQEKFSQAKKKIKNNIY